MGQKYLDVNICYAVFLEQAMRLASGLENSTGALMQGTTYKSCSYWRLVFFCFFKLVFLLLEFFSLT
jgi:hypothetical protein